MNLTSGNIGNHIYHLLCHLVKYTKWSFFN
uniref:Uncharacterized protein n=1 Tax=Arundo donax TaxID=35708 RepID=A0A0A9B0Y2_ARUDO